MLSAIEDKKAQMEGRRKGTHRNLEKVRRRCPRSIR